MCVCEGEGGISWIRREDAQTQFTQGGQQIFLCAGRGVDSFL